MKKGFSCLLAGVIVLGGAALFAGGGNVKDGFAEEGALAAEQEVVAQAQEALAERASSQSSVSGPEVNGDYLSPLVTLRADPYLYKHNGKYYFTGSYPEYDRIELTCADSVNGIAAAVPKTVWTKPDYAMHVWAPEIHYIMGEWVIYYACSENGAWDIKCYALRCKGQDPMHDEWEYMGKIKTAEGDSFSNNSGMSLDMTVFENAGKWYAIWAQKPGASNLYMAELEDPFTLKTHSILLTKPEYDWEKGGGEHVNEGPAVMKHAGKIFVSFSAARTDANYCMGLLEIDETDDPMVIENWKKYPEPVFKSDPELKIYGPGHNCFVEGDEGEQLCVVHFRDYKDISGDSLYDFNRHAHVMKVTFDRHGVPKFHFDPDDLYNSQYTDHNK